MSKKNKKIFKQKMRQMLSQMENTTERPPQVISKGPVPFPSAPTAALKPAAPILSLTPIDVVRSDLKKIFLLIVILLLVVVAAAIISDKTTWLLTIADKIYTFARLGV